MVNLMKYSAFLVPILGLFFFCQATFAQVQSDNPSKSLDINQVSQRLSELEENIEELKKNEKNEVFSSLSELEKSIEPDEEVRDKARESQKILYLVKSKYELEHLYKIHEGENQQRKIRFN